MRRVEVMMSKYFLKSDTSREFGFRNKTDLRNFLFEEVLTNYMVSFATLDDIEGFVEWNRGKLEAYIAKHGDRSFSSLLTSEVQQRMYLLQNITESYELLRSIEQGRKAGHD